jgi:hypothetical protein
MAWNRYAADNPMADRVVFLRQRPRYAAPPVEELPDALTGEHALPPGRAARIAETTRWHQGHVSVVERCDRCGSVEPTVMPVGCTGLFHQRTT